MFSIMSGEKAADEKIDTADDCEIVKEIERLK